jgi:CheY-like chemotaxis protein
MNEAHEKKTLLIAEDDEDHYLLIKEALAAAGASPNLFQVKDGVELLDFLLNKGSYGDTARFPKPSLILLDLNLPKKDGRWALKEIKSHPQLKSIPIIVLTTSQQAEDITCCYREGANAFIQKPAGFKELVDAMKSLSEFWLKVAQLPHA